MSLLNENNYKSLVNFSIFRDIKNRKIKIVITTLLVNKIIRPTALF